MSTAGLLSALLPPGLPAPAAAAAVFKDDFLAEALLFCLLLLLLLVEVGLALLLLRAFNSLAQGLVEPGMIHGLGPGGVARGSENKRKRHINKTLIDN